ncbi:hypothetical protein GP486_004747 [Trichoglossum hirsutum]|uniref:Haloacid dehalogenase-like hydrolase n=1 Tax=Trichoglossum hirsutum TaxID=265104 RepID=A0A9P8LAE9_9PEZI|nr:hypothetical protein GP486_004747 [Trichoglossum hirsutum]
MPPPKTLPTIRAALLDLDGLLINSEGLLVDSIQHLLTSRSCPPMPDNLMALAIGRLSDRFQPEEIKSWIGENILGDGKWTTQEDFEKDVFEKCVTKRPNANLLDGAEDLIRTLAVQAWVAPAGGGLGREKMEIAIVSNSIAVSLAAKCAPHNVFTLIPPSRKFCRDDPRLVTYPRRPKPAPDLFLSALSILNKERSTPPNNQPEIQASECLVFEDSVIGVEAARKAGMRVVWVPHPCARRAYRGQEWRVLSGALGGGESLVEGPGEEGKECGMAEVRDSLVGFEYAKYGIFVDGCEGRLAN